MSTTSCGEQKIITRVFVRRVFVATSGDLKSHHKGWFVAKKHAFVMIFFATKPFSLVVGVTFMGCMAFSFVLGG